MPKPLRIIYAGTPEFAATALQALLKTEHQVIAVYTQPDRPAGRGRKLQASPVKQVAELHHIPVYQPLNFKDPADVSCLRELDADLMVVAAYGLLLPKAVLEAPKQGCINIHASLLPRWRGAAPIQRAILAGDKETGITIMQMDEGLDTGDMLLKISCPIYEEDTGGSLHDQLAELGAQALLDALEKMQQQALTPEAQNNELATYAHKLNKQEASLDWNASAQQLARQVRAFNPWPGSQTQIDNKTLRIWAAEALTDNCPSETSAGTVLNTSKQGIDVCCGEGVQRLLQLQPQGKKAMDISAFLNGYGDLLAPGSILAAK